MFEIDRSTRKSSLSCVLVLTGIMAGSAANLSGAAIGGTASTIAGSGVCSDNKQVLGSTIQDTFSLHTLASCVGSSDSVDMQASALLASIGLASTATPGGPGASTQTAAQVTLNDTWTFSPVIPLGTSLTIPVTFTLDGFVSPGAQTQANQYLTYNFSIYDGFNGPSGTALFQQVGSINSSGVYNLTFAGNVAISYFGPGVGMTAHVSMDLTIPELDSGTVDFLNTGRIILALPDGITAQTSSGHSIAFASATPEPSTWMLISLGLAALTASRRKSLTRR